MKPDLPWFAAIVRASNIAVLMFLGGFAFTIAWLVVAIARDGRAGWMAPFAAMISVAVLRMAGAMPGNRRAFFAALATTSFLSVGEWLVACSPIASAAGMSPFDAAQRMGADFGWMLIRLGNTPLDWGWLILALAIAARLGR